MFGAQTLTPWCPRLWLTGDSPWIWWLFALTALLLAGLGIYGVISYIVTERTHEIGIRLALGAERGNILQWFSSGIAAAIAARCGTRVRADRFALMAGLLYGVRPTDPLTFAGVALLLIGVALLLATSPRAAPSASTR